MRKPRECFFARKMVSVATVAAMTATFCLPTAALAASSEANAAKRLFSSESNESVEVTELSAMAAGGLPSSYSLLNAEDRTGTGDVFNKDSEGRIGKGSGTSYITSVKNQGAWGTCWSFAAIAAAESSIISECAAKGIDLKDTSLWNDETGEIDLSEKHLAWFSQQPISAANGYYASQIGEGLTASTASKALDTGGSAIYGTSLFASGTGVLPETAFPYEGYTTDEATGEKKRSLSMNADWSIDDANRFYYSLELEETKMLASPGAYNAEGEAESAEAANNEIKAELSAGHAVAIAFTADASLPGQTGPAQFINTSTWSHYSYYKDNANHVVTIVGWDDSYSKDNFGVTDKNGNTIAESIPEKDGAWLVKNSWGSGQSAGDNKGNWGVDVDGDEVGDGYFWISYCDKTICDAETFNFVVEDLVNTQRSGNDVAQYDLMPALGYASMSYTVETKMANVFTTERAEEISKLGCTTDCGNVDVTYELRILDDYELPEGGESAYTATVHYDNAGFHTIEIPEPVALGAGQRYTVLVTVVDENGEYVVNYAYGTTLEGWQDYAKRYYTSDEGRKALTLKAEQKLADTKMKELSEKYGFDPDGDGSEVSSETLEAILDELFEYYDSGQYDKDLEAEIAILRKEVVEQCTASYSTGVVNYDESYLCLSGNDHDFAVIASYRNDENTTIDNFPIKAYGYYDAATESEASSMKAALKSAEKALASVKKSSKKGADVVSGAKWISKADYADFAETIAYAKEYLAGSEVAGFMTKLFVEDLDSIVEAVAEADYGTKALVVNAKTVSAKTVKAAAKKAGANVAKVKKLTLGKKVRTVKAKAFAKCKSLKTLTVKSTKLKKTSIKKSLTSSKVKTVKVPKSKKTAYKAIFTKAICGKRVAVK